MEKPQAVKTEIPRLNSLLPDLQLDAGQDFDGIATLFH